MNRSKPNFGWVLRSVTTGHYLEHTEAEVNSGRFPLFYGNEELRNAHVFTTRKLARTEKDSWERVFKVMLNAQGKAQAIISNDM